MKKSVFYISGLCLLLLLGGCKSRPAAEAQPQVRVTEVRTETAVPTDIPVIEAVPTAVPTEVPDEERILAHCESIRDALPYGADLDGDGQTEIVDLTTLPGDGDDCRRWTVSVQKGNEVKLFRTDIPDDMPCDLWVGDLDEDGGYEIFFHGDMASDDYLIYAWRHDLSLLFFEPDDRFLRRNEQEGESSVFAGRIEGFEDGHIVIEGVVDMLGTHWGVRNFAIGDDGIIGPVSTVWSFDEEPDRMLTVTQALKAYQAGERKDPGEEFTLEPGERILPLCSDGCERLWFETEQGKHGVLLLTPDEEDMWLIDGTPEADCFETLPYSG